MEKQGVELVVDRDTLNEPGTPEITTTILRKIDDCHIFLADMTFVTRTRKGKNHPNSNVMLEFGYALKTWEVIPRTALIPAGELASGDFLEGLLEDVWAETGSPTGSPSYENGRWQPAVGSDYLDTR